MNRREFRRKRWEKKAGKRQKKWIRESIKGEKWVRRKKVILRAAAGIFFVGWAGLWLYHAGNKKVAKTETYLLPDDQNGDLYQGKTIEWFGIQIRIDEGNITFFREKREAAEEEY